MADGETEENGIQLDFVSQNVGGEEPILSGYLHKKTRDGRWQKRYFETNGHYLTYYKSRKMEKLLAALSLPQVGEIKQISPEDDPEKKDGLFALELNTRIYTLRAKSNEDAKKWVTVLNELKSRGSFATVSPIIQRSESDFDAADSPVKPKSSSSSSNSHANGHNSSNKKEASPSSGGGEGDWKKEARGSSFLCACCK